MKVKVNIESQSHHLLASGLVMQANKKTRLNHFQLKSSVRFPTRIQLFQLLKPKVHVK